MEFKIMTLGCKVNQAEGSGLAQALREMGLTEAQNATEAGILIVNSCAVTAESVRKAKQLLRSLRRRNPQAKLILTGCWPQAFPEDDFEEADFVTGTKNRDDVLAWIAQAHAEEQTRSIVPYQAGDTFSALPCADTTRTRAFLKIQDGCNQFCSYCIIPFSRGRCRSMPPERLEAEVKALAEAVAVCAEQPGVLRVRLGSLEPERMDQQTLEALAACEKFCPQFHLSLQSGCDSVLKRMNRRYISAEYRDLAARIRRIFPHSALTTDVIVGFPGETDADFEETLRFVEEIRFTKVHVFPYSPRTGTRAASFPDQIPQNVKSERAARLSKLADGIRRAHLAEQVGQTVQVLVEGEKQQNAQRFYQGHTPDGTVVKIFQENAEKGLQNSAICVTIKGYEDDCLTARV